MNGIYFNGIMNTCLHGNSRAFMTYLLRPFFFLKKNQMKKKRTHNNNENKRK